MHTVAWPRRRRDATVTLDRSVLVEIGAAELTATARPSTPAGSRSTATPMRSASLFDHLDMFMSMFPIVEP